MTKPNLSLEERIALHTKRLDNGCLVWTSYVPPHGYPLLKVGGRMQRVSRLLLNAGPGECALHTCDTPRCVERTHLFKGTHKDNTQDMIVKGRAKLGNCKIDKAIAEEIRSKAKLGRAALAAQYSLSKQHVGRILTGSAWRS